MANPDTDPRPSDAPGEPPPGQSPSGETEPQADAVENWLSTWWGNPKRIVAGQMNEFARAMRAGAAEVATSQAPAARVAERGAERLESLATQLDEQEVEELLRSVSETSKRHPALFLAGSVAAGFFLTRLFRSGYLPGDEEPVAGPDEPAGEGPDAYPAAVSPAASTTGQAPSGLHTSGLHASGLGAAGRSGAPDAGR